MLPDVESATFDGARESRADGKSFPRKFDCRLKTIAKASCSKFLQGQVQPGQCPGDAAGEPAVLVRFGAALFRRLKHSRSGRSGRGAVEVDACDLPFVCQG